MHALTQGIVFLTVAGMMVNETFGPYLLFLSLAGWILLTAQHAGRTAGAIAGSGLLVWLMPCWALASVLWSEEVSVTLRAAIETVLTIVLAALVTRAVSPRNFVIILFLVLGLVALLSVPINHLSLDGMSGATNRTGIYLNKNTFSDCTATLVMVSLFILTDRGMARWLRAAAVPLIGLGLVQNILSHSVATTLALALAAGWGGLMVLANGLPVWMRTVYVTFAVLSGVAVLSLGGFLAVAFQGELLSTVGKDPTLTGRTELWFYAARFLEVCSSLGVGYAAFWVRGHPLAEYLWHLEHMDSGAGFHFHNLYYEIAVELGIPGVIMGGLVIAATCVAVVRWLRTDRSSASIFFFSFMVFVLIIQTQGYDLFATFDPWYFTFSVALVYGRTWQRWRPAARAGAPVTLHLPFGAGGPISA